MNRQSIITAAALAALATTALAHHSFAMFDQTKRVTLKGTVTDFQWTNPHAFIHLSVPATGGAKEDWEIELNSPNNLKRQGWKATSLKSGDQVTLVTFPLRDLKDHKGGLFVTLTLADGTVLAENAFAGSTGPINVPEAPAASTPAK
jgi:hypothetical protein